MTYRVTLRELLDSMDVSVKPVHPSLGLDRVFTHIDFLSGHPGNSRSNDTLWIYSNLAENNVSVLDAWILSLADQGAPGLVVVSQTLSDANRLLSDRLGLPLMTVTPTDLGSFLRQGFRLLMSNEARAMEEELQLLSDTLLTWQNNTTLEGFQRGLAAYGIRVERHLSGGSAAARTLGWGRGSGERFAISVPIESDRLLHLVEMTLAVLLDRDAAEIESILRHRSEFLLELLVDPRVPTGSVIRAATRYNLDLGRIHTAFIWDVDNFAQYTVAAGTEQRILRTKGALLDALELAAKQVFSHGMVLPHSDEFVMIVEGRERLTPERALVGAKTVMEQLRPVLAQCGVAGLTCGIGFPYDGPEGLRKSFEEAHEALTVGRARYGFGTIAHFKDLGIDRFLYGWLDSPRSRQLAQGLLNPILGEPNRDELLDTLRVYLECMGRRSQAAQTLHIHRNTLSYRIQHLEQLLKLDLNDAAAQLVLQLALKAHPEMH